MSLILAFISLFASTSAHAMELRGIQNNNDGVKRFKEERLNESYKQFASSLSDLPFQPEVHYNLGRTFFENKEYEKAVQESLTAAKLAEKNKHTKFLALFQAAAAQGELKKIDEALALYQQALEIKPDSKEAKTNIELLTSQQQGGGGGQDQKQQNKKEDGKDQKEGDQEGQENKPRTNEGAKPTPKPFKSEDLSKKDVENILDELERQEEQIRAKYQREGRKDAPKDKDW